MARFVVGGGSKPKTGATGSKAKWQAGGKAKPKTGATGSQAKWKVHNPSPKK